MICMSSINKKTLIKLYIKRRLSLAKTAKILKVSKNKVWYWMIKHNIPRRGMSEAKRKYNIAKNTLIKLYIEKKMSSPEIARELGVKSYDTVLNYLKRYDIQRRTQSEIKTKFPKKSFSGNLNEKAYMLGLRAGDISAKRNHSLVRVHSGTTHLSQVKMFKGIFGKYGHIHIYTVHYSYPEWRMDCDLNKSFEFLLRKPTEIPNWILERKNIFYSFLAGYMDCEGSWDIRKSNRNNVRISFRIRTSDKKILLQLKKKMKDLGCTPIFHLEKRKGKKTNLGRYNKDFFALLVLKYTDVKRLAKILLPLSNHLEKIRKMGLILEIDTKNWEKIKHKVLNLREMIKKEHINVLGSDFHETDGKNN